MDKSVSILAILNYLINWLVSVTDWIETHSNLVTATATIAIAAFTLTLWCATRKLWKISLKQSNDLKTSLSIAQKAADAARDSADAFPTIERAYIFAKVKRHPDVKPGQTIEAIKEGYNQARVIATNHGKTPAIITKINWYVGVFEDVEIDNKITELEYIPDSMVPPSIIINSGDTKKGLPDCNISIQERDNIGNKANYACFGRIDYKDIFDKPHTTIFCWKDDGVFCSPDPDPERNYWT